MHPGPMNEGVEIAADVAAGAQSVITDQVTNGVAIRMALLYLLAGVAVGRAWRRVRMTDLDIGRAWLVDPAAGREGPGDIVVRDGVARSRSPGSTATTPMASTRPASWWRPASSTCTSHLREPGNEDAETVASGLAAAAHGGFTTVCAMPNTTPTLDEPGVLTRIRAAALASGSPVELLAHGAVTVGRAGEALAALGELADAGVVGFSRRRRRRSGRRRSCATPWPTPARSGSRSSTIRRTRPRPRGRRPTTGTWRPCSGLRGWPSAAEEAAVARDLAILADVVRDVPGARLHLTHVSTAGSIELIRRAKAAGLPVTCDVTPHHLALTDEWVAGARRFAWEAGPDGDPWRDDARVAEPFSPSLRVNPPLRTPADVLACLAALADGTIDAIATDHAPHTEVDKAVEFGQAANGISGIETALGLVLAAVDAGQLTLARVIEALTVGPAALLGGRTRRADGVGFAEGAAADLVDLRSLGSLDGDRRGPRFQGQELATARRRSRGPRAPDDGRRPGRVRGPVRLTHPCVQPLVRAGTSARLASDGWTVG